MKIKFIVSKQNYRYCLYFIRRTFPRWLISIFDTGPGVFMIPQNYFMGTVCRDLITASSNCLSMILNLFQFSIFHLAENRSITDDGLSISEVTAIAILNLSLVILQMPDLLLPSLPKVTFLDLSYCNRISRGAAKYVR